MRTDEAQLVLEKFSNQPVIIKYLSNIYINTRSQPVTITRSTYAEMPKPDPSPESPVVFVMFLSKITLTPQAIYNQFHTHGKILKVVIPRNSATRALIQFENTSEATNFIKTINNTYVTIGEYTSRLSALYSHFQDLNVSENNEKSYDFTLPPSQPSIRTRKSPGVIGGERNIHINSTSISPTDTPLKQQQQHHSHSSSPITSNTTNTANTQSIQQQQQVPPPPPLPSDPLPQQPQMNIYDATSNTVTTSIDPSITNTASIPPPPTTNINNNNNNNNSSSSYPNHYNNNSRYNNSFYHNNNGYNNGYNYNNNNRYNSSSSSSLASNHSCVLLVHGFDPHFVTIQMLHTLFNNAGLVKCIKIHHSKEGYAFVQMSNLEEAEFAKNHFNLLDIDGKTLNVNYSKYDYIEGSEDKPQYFQSYHLNTYTKRYPPSEPSLQLWCTSWASNPDQNQLLNQFNKYGEVANIKVTPHNDKYYVFVRYTHLAHATKAMLCLTGQTVCNSLRLRIMYSRSTVRH